MAYICNETVTAFQYRRYNNIGHIFTVNEGSKWVKIGIDHNYYVRLQQENQKNKNLYIEVTKPIFEKYFKPVINKYRRPYRKLYEKSTKQPAI